MLYSLTKPFLFALDPEDAHDLAIKALASSKGLVRLPRVSDPIELMGLTFPNRVGLAAGLDKNAVAIRGMQGLGFGFVEVGTVTPKPQPGNPKPRMFRLKEESAIINRMGFNNGGVAALVERVQDARSCSNKLVPIGINIGKNKDTPADRAAEDYCHCLEAVAPLADYVTVNLSSPNTPGLRDLQFGEALKNLLDAICEKRELLAVRPPLLIKLAPDMCQEDLVAVTGMAGEMGIDGLIVSNTTVSRTGVESSRFSGEAGGLSGKPLFDTSTAALRTVAQERSKRGLQDSLILIGVGGIDSADRAAEKISVGADLVQIYSGLIYRGPSLISTSAQAIKKRLAVSAVSDDEGACWNV